MPSWFEGMNGLDRVFTVCAIVGGVLLLLRLVLLFAGGDADMDADMDVDVDTGLDAHVDTEIEGAGELGESDFSFRILSVHGITSFSMMFGLVGLALSRSSGASPPVALAGAVGAGLAMVWVVSWMFVLAKRLQHSGTLKIANAIGKEGTVYLTIPAGGTGKARVAVQGRLKIFEAKSEDKSEIPTDARIKVVQVVSGNVLVVKKLS